MKIIKVTAKEIPQISVIHKSVFKDHFLGKMPLKIIDLFYQEYLDAECFIAAESDGKLVGFVLGGLGSEMNRYAYNFQCKNKVVSTMAILKDPMLWSDSFKKLMGFMKLKLNKQKFNSSKGYESACCLLSIAVDKSFQGKGCSQELISVFENKAKNLGYDQTYLTVKRANNRAINFYKKIGMSISERDISSYYFDKNI